MEISNINEIVLLEYCRREDPHKSIESLLKNNNSIDILYGEGLALERCIKKNDLVSTSLLLNYYIKNNGGFDLNLRRVLGPLMEEWGSPTMRKMIESLAKDKILENCYI